MPYGGKELSHPKSIIEAAARTFRHAFSKSMALVRSQPMRSGARRLFNLIATHTGTLVFGFGGFAVGAFIDNVLTFSVIGIPLQLTWGIAWAAVGFIGAALGFLGDRREINRQKNLQRLIEREFTRTRLASGAMQSLTPRETQHNQPYL